MTDEDIIKALNYCKRSVGAILCTRDCPMYSECDSEEPMTDICGLAVDFINRQKAEIKRLETELKAMRGAANTYKKHYETAKSEAIKEFAERLKERADSGFWQEHSYVDVDDIDNLVKEMTEGGENNG